jgi:hypothetical protein
MGKPGPQPRSITAAPPGTVRAHSRTACTSIPVERPLPRRARNSTATPSYAFDRSILGYQYQKRAAGSRKFTDGKSHFSAGLCRIPLDPSRE